MVMTISTPQRIRLIDPRLQRNISLILPLRISKNSKSSTLLDVVRKLISCRFQNVAKFIAGNIQFDDPLLAYFCADSMIAGMEEREIDHVGLLDLYIKVYNDCLKGRPADLTVGLHLCRGNFKGGLHFSEGGYDRIAVKLFQQINVDCYYLEYDTERAGTFEPLKYLPKHKSVVLGLISSKVPQVHGSHNLKAKNS